MILPVCTISVVHCGPSGITRVFPLMASKHMAKPQLANSPAADQTTTTPGNPHGFLGDNQHMPDFAVYCKITCILFLYRASHVVLTPGGAVLWCSIKAVFILDLSGCF